MNRPLICVLAVGDGRYSVSNYGPYTQPGRYNVQANVSNAITTQGEIFTCTLNVQIPPVNVRAVVRYLVLKIWKVFIKGKFVLRYGKT